MSARYTAAQHRADPLGGTAHRGVAGRAGLVFGERAIRRAEPQRERQRLAILPRAAGRCRRRTAGRPPAAPRRRRGRRPPPSARRRPRRTTRLTSWNTAGNGETRGAGNASTMGMASRFSSTAQVPLGRPERSITAGCSWPGVADDGFADEHFGAPARMPRQVLGGPQPYVDSAGTGDDPDRLERIGGFGAPALAPGAARLPQPGQHRGDVLGLPRQRRVEQRDLRRRWDVGPPGSARRSWSARSAAPPARSRTARRRRCRETRCAPTLPAAPAAAWWPDAADRPPAG